MAVQIGRIKPNSDLFDNTVGYDDETGIKFASGLADSERYQATALYRLFNELWGVCIVTGLPGTGKDLFGNYISYKMKEFFPHKRILRDEKPRQLYGEYAGLFNEAVLASDLSRMREIAKGHKIVEIDKVMDKAADDWVTDKGQVLLKNSVLYLTEYWRYCYNRDPHNPMNKTMGGIHRQKRHLDCLILGTVQNPRELDKNTCLLYVDWATTCVRSAKNRTSFTYFIQKVKYEPRLDILAPISDPFTIQVDAGQPKTELGDGKIVIRQKDYEPETEEERVVLEVLKAGADTYEQVVEILEAEGDMLEDEVLKTLKRLKFNPSKRVIDYPCWFGIYNSKSAPQIKTTLRIKD